jgi:F-type H+-transporting ATPase subunit alpha
MVELLKQQQYAPFSLAEQVVSIFAGTQGHLDDLPVNDVLRFEKDLMKHIHGEFPEVLKEMTDTGELSSDLSGTLSKIITDFKTQFRKT